MAQQNEKQPKAKTGLARCLELASGHKGLVFLAGFLAALAAICSFVPYLSIYYIIREILFVYPDMSLLNVSTISTWGWLTLAGILGNIVFYFFALLCSHVAAFGTLYELKVAFADHIMHIPLGYHLTLGSGKLRKIMDENIESVEKFIAHQLPDFVASLVAPLVLVIILLGIDWRYGVVCLVGIVLAFIVQFAGFNGEAKEKMHRFQTAQENMNSASVEYVRGMSEIKAFNQNVGCKGVQPDRILFQKAQRSDCRIYRVGPEIFSGLAELYACFYHDHQQYLSAFDSGGCSDRDAYCGFQGVFADIHFLPDYCPCDFRCSE